MNPRKLCFGLGVTFACVTQILCAQSGDSGRTPLAEIRVQAENGHAQAQYELGEAFFRGELGVAQDETEAAKWFRKAAEQNLAEAQYNLGVCYAKGQGVAQDAAEAVAWYRKAAAQNLAPAQYNLGVCCSRGRGVAEDPVEAVTWYRRAAAQNLAEALYNLGVCYAQGNGVATDDVEACKWWVLAAAQGEEEAETNRTKLEATMSPEQIAEAKQRAKAWLSQRPKASAAPETSRILDPTSSER